MAVKNIDVCFNLVDNFSKNFEKSISALNNGSKSAQRAWKQVGKVGQSISNVGAGITAAVTTPLVGLGVTAFNEFDGVNKSIRLVKATMGETKWATGDLTSAMKEAATQSIFGMQDAADACINFARQGFSAKESADMISGAMQLAVGTGTDLATVTSGLGNTLKAFHADSFEATHYTDMMAQAQAQANITATDLFNAMSVAGPMMRTVGWSFSDLATLTGEFGDNSIGASEGATALNTGLMRIASPAKAGSKAIKKLGIDVWDSKGQLESMPVVMGKLQAAFKGLTQQRKLAAASDIFGKNQASKWMALINGDGQEALTKAKDQIDSASGVAKSMSDALVTPMEAFKSTVDVFKYNVGETIGGVVNPFIEKITALIQKFNEMTPAQQQQIEKWALMAAAAGPAIWAFGKTVKGITDTGIALNGLALAGVNLAPSLKGASMITKVFGGVLAGITSPTAIVIGVLAGLIAASILVWKNWDKITAAFDKAKPKLTPIINLFKSLARVAEAVWGAIKRFASGFAKGFTKNVDMSGMISGFKKGINTIKETIKPLIPVISNVFNNIAGFIRKHGPEIRAFGTVVGMVVGKIITVVGNGLGVAFQIASKVISVSIKACVAAIKGFATYAGPIINGFKKILNSLITFITGVFTGNWGKAWQGVVDLFKSIFETVVSIAKGVVNGVASAINTVIGAINGINFKVPDWVPGVGGKSFSVDIPKIPTLAKGSENWQGGIAQVSEKGGEIIDLPKGSRVYPHDKSVEMARGENRQQSVTINIPKLADQITVREDADIDKIIDGLTRRLQQVSKNVGTVGAMA